MLCQLSYPGMEKARIAAAPRPTVQPGPSEHGGEIAGITQVGTIASGRGSVSPDVSQNFFGGEVEIRIELKPRFPGRLGTSESRHQNKANDRKTPGNDGENHESLHQSISK
jgi:hypothetical protein